MVISARKTTKQTHRRRSVFTHVRHMEISHKLPPLEHAATSIVPILQLETESRHAYQGHRGKGEGNCSISGCRHALMQEYIYAIAMNTEGRRMNTGGCLTMHRNVGPEFKLCSPRRADTGQDSGWLNLDVLPLSHTLHWNNTPSTATPYSTKMASQNRRPSCLQTQH